MHVQVLSDGHPVPDGVGFVMPRRNCHARELIEMPDRFDGLKEILWGRGRERDRGAGQGAPGAEGGRRHPGDAWPAPVGPGAPLGSPAGV